MTASFAEAKKRGNRRTKREAVTAVLDEYIQRCKQQKTLSLFGTIEYDQPADTSVNAVRETGSLCR